MGLVKQRRPAGKGNSQLKGAGASTGSYILYETHLRDHAEADLIGYHCEECVTWSIMAVTCITLTGGV